MISMLTANSALAETGIDGVALKPEECDVRRAIDLPVDTVAIDYEGRDVFPDADTLAELAAEKNVRVTTPVRADGFDPLGDDSLLDTLPSAVSQVLVAGHSAYLTEAEQSRAIAPRLRAAVERAADPWVGTEGIERIALATGAAQYELLTRTTERDLRALRAAGFEDELVLYAPLALTDDEDAILDAVGAYAARRQPVARALPDGEPVDADAAGHAREILLQACRDYALVGAARGIGEQVAALEDAGADQIVAYPAQGMDAFLAE